MVLIGIIQISVSAGLGLIVPDKGGGFGMFSGIDGAQTRYAYMVLITDKGNIRVPASLSGEHLKLLKSMNYCPTTARMVNMARIFGLAMQDQRDIDLTKQKEAENPAQVTVIPEFNKIRLEIWSTEFASDTQTVTYKTLKDITISWPGGELLKSTTPSTKPFSL